MYDRNYYLEHKEEFIKRANAWRKLHPRKEREYYLKNRSKIIARTKKYYLKNKDKIVLYRKEYWQRLEVKERRRGEQGRLLRKRFPIKDREAYLLYLNKYRANMPPERKRAYGKVRHNNRRRREKEAGKFNTFEWLVLVKKCDNKCLDCGNQEPFVGQLYEYLTIDHIIPLIKGGTNDIKNIQPLCFNCNMRKGIKIIKAPALLDIGS